jgi:hypothetical protein
MAEDLRLCQDLLKMIPAASQDWRPAARPGFSLGELQDHLRDAAGALCACFHRLHPERFAHFTATAPEGLETFRVWIQDGFAATQDEDLSRPIVTHFSPEGELFLSVLMSNWKHFHLHTYQLFTYLRELGVPATTEHLYCFAAPPTDLP